MEILQPLQDISCDPQDGGKRQIAGRICQGLDRAVRLVVHGEDDGMLPRHRHDIGLVDVHEVVVLEPVADLGFTQPLVH
jgi:hypothetical protein